MGGPQGRVVRGKFRRTLGALGFGVTRVEKTVWRATDNITVTARKSVPPLYAREELVERARDLLGDSLVDDSPTEQRLHDVWLDSLAGPDRAR